jgi:ubiquinone/menaquinone biosynthesis C-methylase UbiE
LDDVTPAPFVDALLGYQQTAALYAAVKLDLFSLVCAGTDTAEGIAAASGAAPRGIRILADYLTIRGFLEKSGQHYRPAPVARAFLDRASPSCMSGIVDFLASREMLAVFLDDPVSYVRNGGAPGLGTIAPENPVWVTFAEAMGSFIGGQANLVAVHVAAWTDKPRRVLDIAAGHGLFGITVAKAVPGAEITAVDWPAVLEVARANAERAGVTGRYHLCPGNAFDVDWGTGFDLAMLPNFLHHFDHDGCVAILRRVRASLAPGGRTLVVEFMPNEDRVSPPMAGMFSFTMLASTPSGDAYTHAELEAMGRDAGYTSATVTQLLPTPQTLIELI